MDSPGHKASKTIRSEMVLSLIDRFPKNLTKSEKDVAEKIIMGLSNQQIAKTRFTCESSVKFHISKIFKKTNVKTRMEFIAHCLNVNANEGIKEPEVVPLLPKGV